MCIFQLKVMYLLDKGISSIHSIFSENTQSTSFIFSLSHAMLIEMEGIFERKNTMDCPVCRQAMKPLVFGDVQVDECRQCRGIWFDRGVLEEVKDKVDPDLRFLDFEIWSPKALFNINADSFSCPRCRKIAMRQINFQEPDIDITFCPFCEGVWLNAGDFKKILDAFSKEAASMNVSDYVKTSLMEASEIFTNPGRVLSEWKDLKAVLRMLRYRVFIENPKLRSILAGIQKSLPL